MNKTQKMSQSIRARALASIEKKSSAARDGGSTVPNDNATADAKKESAAPSGSAGVQEGKSNACSEADPSSRNAEPASISNVGRQRIKPDGTMKGRKPIFERGGSVPDIFPDGEVCRLLGKNRDYLIRARKSKSRREDWDTIGHHAGMTASWILKENPDAELERITQWRIKPGDGVVSVEVLQHTMDCRKLACKRLSDGMTVVVMVDEASRFRDGDQFDAQELGGTYRWNAALNRI